MLRQVADGVLVHESEFCQSNAVVVQGRADVLLIDPGVLGGEMAGLADDLRELGQPVAAGFSTHPHWDHLLWHARLGAAPRYGTARCAATVRDRLPDAGAKARIAARLIRFPRGSDRNARMCVPCVTPAFPTTRGSAPSATFGRDWLPGVHQRQLEQLARRSDRD
ncbi:MAG: MBL fold metallo-hydrolase [Trebonia sp.]